MLYSSLLLKPRQDPVGAFGIQSGALFSHTVYMKNFVVQSGDFITTSGIFRMNDHPERRQCRILDGDAVPTFHGKKITFRLIRAAKNPRRG